MTETFWLTLICLVSVIIMLLIVIAAMRQRNEAQLERDLWKETSRVLSARMAKLESEQIDYMLQKCRNLYES